DDWVVDALLVPAGEHVEEEEPVDEEHAVEPEGDEEVEGSVEPAILTVTEHGYGKRTPFSTFPLQGRYGKGVISHRTSDEVGGVAGALVVHPDDELMLVTDSGRVIRISAGSVRFVRSRNSKGVRLMRLDPGERLVDVARLETGGEAEVRALVEAEPGDAVGEE